MTINRIKVFFGIGQQAAANVTKTIEPLSAAKTKETLLSASELLQKDDNTYQQDIDQLIRDGIIFNPSAENQKEVTSLITLPNGKTIDPSQLLFIQRSLGINPPSGSASGVENAVQVKLAGLKDAQTGQTGADVVASTFNFKF